jgi:hypothetical protein
VSTRQLGRQMAEALAILSAGVTMPRASARNIHHVRISGDPAKVDELLSELQRGDYGAQIVQRQRYSDTVAAVNLSSDPMGNLLEIDRLLARAGELGVIVKVDFISQ